MQVRATDHIDQSAIVTISYISLLKPREKRRQLLKEKFYFDCECIRCSDPNNNLADSLLYDLIEDNLKRHSQLTKQRNFAAAFELLNATIPLVEKITGRFAPFVTILNAKLLLCKLMAVKINGLDECPVELDQLRDRLRMSISVTHGLEHSVYQQYESLIIEDRAIRV